MLTSTYVQGVDAKPADYLSDSTWAALKPLLFKIRNTQGPSKRQADRDFISAVAYLSRTGKPWRDLPPAFGNWHTVYMRFRRWEQARVWAELWIEMDDRAHDLFERTFFHDSHDNHLECEKCKGGIRTRLRRAIEMSVF